MSKPPAVLVETGAQLREACARLAGGDRYFIDTEFERSREVEKLCLIQVSRGEEVYVVDTVKLTALEPLAGAIARPAVEWVLHAAVEDVEFLSRNMKFDPRPRIFDTQVAWGLLSPEYPVSLAYLLYRILSIRNPKDRQAGDWLRRPLSQEQVAYAAEDVEHLPDIYDRLAGQLGKLGRGTVVHEVTTETLTPSPADPLAIEDFRNAWQLDAAGLAALRYLVNWHNQLTPQECDKAPWPKVLFTIAKMLPESATELTRIKGIHIGWAKRNGDRLTGNIMQAIREVSEADHAPFEPPPYNTFERILAEGWMRNTIAEVSAEIGMAPELAFPSKTARIMTRMVTAGRKKEAAAELKGWREKVVGEPFLARCK